MIPQPKSETILHSPVDVATKNFHSQFQQLDPKRYQTFKSYTAIPCCEKGIAVWGKCISSNPKVFDLSRGIERFFKDSDAGLLQFSSLGRLVDHFLESTGDLKRKPFSISDVNSVVQGDLLYQSTVEHLERMGISLDAPKTEEEGEEEEEKPSGTLAAIDVMNRFKLSDYDCIETEVLDNAYSGYPSSDPRAAACLVRVKGSTDALAAAIESNLSPGPDDSFNISPVLVTATKLNPDIGAPETNLEEEDKAGRTLALPAAAAFCAAADAVPPPLMHQDHIDKGPPVQDVTKPTTVSLLVGDYHQLGVWMACGGKVVAFDPAPTLARGLLTSHRIEKEGEEKPEPEPEPVPRESTPVLMVFASPGEFIDKLTLDDAAVGKYMTRLGRATASVRGRLAQNENFFLETARDNQGKVKTRVGRTTASESGRLAQKENFFLETARDNQGKVKTHVVRTTASESGRLAQNDNFFLETARVNQATERKHTETGLGQDAQRSECAAASCRTRTFSSRRYTDTGGIGTVTVTGQGQDVSQTCAE
ncbi:hypothetical protein MSG28_015313 [Choristoneura fumiferana]|uniref:Uncharacterized protein n=1 Tax=Choristoneura fumiferana TaxID=7141 RepID=A0ACC0K9S9_CHOFU|nr:hypothetical protein MSG28_015313 [Choristoneura fumiferana]